MRNCTQSNMSAGELESVGDFYWSERITKHRRGPCMTVLLPHPRKKNGQKVHIWPREYGFDDNYGQPTMSTSIVLHTEQGGHSWHGFIRNGYLVEYEGTQ